MLNHAQIHPPNPCRPSAWVLVRKAFLHCVQTEPGWSMLDAQRAMRRVEVGGVARQIVSIVFIDGLPVAKAQCLPFEGKHLNDAQLEQVCLFQPQTEASGTTASVVLALSELIAGNLLQVQKRLGGCVKQL